MSTKERWLHFAFYKLSCLSHFIVVTKVVFQASINYLLCEIDFMFYILIRISSMTLFEGWTFKESFQHLIPLKCLSIKLSKMSACWQFWLSCLQEHIFYLLLKLGRCISICIDSPRETADVQTRCHCCLIAKGKGHKY